mmetsp:Transcript_47574/g.121414  ORF Transcript_47574/g.121414 Transcript_47574/m.121414 type:complete len:351 (-) Transcript_47574:126-1178(-)
MAGIVFKRLCCCFDSDDVHTQQCALAMLRLVWQIQDVLSAVIIADCEADSVSTPREQSLRGAVLVHPLASLPPKQPGVDILCQKWARAVLGVAQSAVQDAHYGQACIQPDEVGQGKRAHWLVGAQLHAHVDVFRRRDALHQRKEGLVNHRHQDAVHHEARPIRRHADLLAHALRQGARCSVCLFVSVHPADDFDQAHQRRRVHPVHPHHFLRPSGCGRQARYRDGACVCGKDAVWRGHLIKGLKDGLLQLLFLGGGLHHKVRCLQALELRQPGNSVSRRDRVPLRQGAFPQQPRQRCADGVFAPLQRLLAGVAQEDLVSRGGCHLSNARPHLPGSNDPDDPRKLCAGDRG